jgi:hypothetical protein
VLVLVLVLVLCSVFISRPPSWSSGSAVLVLWCFLACDQKLAGATS